MEQYIVNGKVFLDGSFQEKTIGIEGGCLHIFPKEEKPHTMNANTVQNIAVYFKY